MTRVLGKTMVILATMLLAAVSSAPGRDLKVVNVDEVDYSDIRSLVATATRGCHTDQEKMIGLWAAITRKPFYHWEPPLENPEYSTELGYVIDPISGFNVHGQTICFMVAHQLAVMAHKAGYEVQMRALPGHCVTEVKYGGSWHLFDAQWDCASYHHGDDGQTILNHAGICANPQKYIVNQANPSDPFYQWDWQGTKFWAWGSKQWVASNFYTGSSDIYASLLCCGHTMLFDLRRGERLVRYFDKLGMWYVPAAVYNSWTDPWKNIGPHDPRGPKNAYCNGVLLYAPDWKAHANNFLDGLYQGSNYVLDNGKVRPAGAGDCTVIFRVFSPYLIVGKPGNPGTAGDSYGGALFQAEFYRKDISASNSVAISKDNGLTWQTVWTNSQTGTTTVKLDLTNNVEWSYHYLVKVSLRGDSPADASIANLRLTNYLMMSPATLPAVETGRNHFRFTCKEQENVLIVRPDMSSAASYPRFFSELNNMTYSTSFPSHLSPASGKAAYAVTEVVPPPGSQVKWLTVDGMFGSRGTTDMIQMLYRKNTDPATQWRLFYKGNGRGGSHWRQDCTADAILDAPADRVYVKFRIYRNSGHMSLNGFKLYAHYLRPEPALPRGSVRVTHSWLEDGRAKSFSVVPRLDGHDYFITVAGTNVKNRLVAIEVANEEQ